MDNKPFVKIDLQGKSCFHKFLKLSSTDLLYANVVQRHLSKTSAIRLCFNNNRLLAVAWYSLARCEENTDQSFNLETSRMLEKIAAVVLPVTKTAYFLKELHVWITYQHTQCCFVFDKWLCHGGTMRHTRLSWKGGWVQKWCVDQCFRRIVVAYVLSCLETQPTWLLTVLMRLCLEKIHLERDELSKTQLSLPTCTHRKLGEPSHVCGGCACNPYSLPNQFRASFQESSKSWTHRPV